MALLAILADPMNPLATFYRSSIGKKWIVALTGLVLIAYVLGHLIGNLQIFLPDKSQINNYGKFLHNLGLALWAIRIFLLACFALHIVATIQLALENRAARPERYVMVKRARSSLAGRTMWISGLIVLCFVIFHILHFTAHTIDPRFANLRETLPDGTERHDVYRMIVLGFQNYYASGFYIVGMFLLCSHLSHGFGSFFQTLGLNSQRLSPIFAKGGHVLAWAIFVGYVSIPVAVMIGFLHL